MEVPRAAQPIGRGDAPPPPLHDVGRTALGVGERRVARISGPGVRFDLIIRLVRSLVTFNYLIPRRTRPYTVENALPNLSQDNPDNYATRMLRPKTIRGYRKAYLRNTYLVRIDRVYPPIFVIRGYINERIPINDSTGFINGLVRISLNFSRVTDTDFYNDNGLEAFRVILINLTLLYQYNADDVDFYSIQRRGFGFRTLVEFEERLAHLVDELSQMSNSTVAILVIGFDLYAPLELRGGCSSRNVVRRVMKNGLVIEDVKSTNNNCGIRCFQRGLPLDHPFKKMYAATLRNVHMKLTKKNSFLSFFDIGMLSDAAKYGVEIVNIDGQTLYSTNTIPRVRLLYHENHYSYIIDHFKKKCDQCGREYQFKHTCNEGMISFFQKKFKKQPICDFIKGNSNTTGDKITNKRVIIFDIETFQFRFEHVVYAVGWWDSETNLYYSEYGQQSGHLFTDYLLSVTNAVIVAYFGAVFDFRFLLRELINKKIKVNNICMANGRLLRFDFNDNHVFDIGQFTLSSLSRACRDFDVSEQNVKSVFPHHAIRCWDDTEAILHNLTRRDFPENHHVEKLPARFNVREECLKYLKIDVMGTVEVFYKFEDFVNTTFTVDLTKYVTLSHLAFTLWKRMFDEEIEILRHEKYNAVIQSIFGGRVYPVCRYFMSSQYLEVMAGDMKHCDVTDYLFDADVRSLYPFAMKKQFPIGRGRWVINQVMKSDYVIEKGIYFIHYIPNANLLHPILPRKENGRLIWDLNPSSGWYTHIDIQNAVKRGYRVTLEKGYVWDEWTDIFSTYIDTCYQVNDYFLSIFPSYLFFADEDGSYKREEQSEKTD